MHTNTNIPFYVSQKAAVETKRKTNSNQKTTTNQDKSEKSSAQISIKDEKDFVQSQTGGNNPTKE